MHSYIVRIYRREGKRPERLLGMVEIPGNKEKIAFTDYDELWEILRSPRRGKEKIKKGGKSS